MKKFQKLTSWQAGKLTSLMTLVLILVAMIVLSMTGTTIAQAADPVTVKTGFSITSPMETAAVGFWFPADGTFAAGISHTVLRVTHSDIPKLRLDLDGTIAQVIIAGAGEEKNTLGGVGIKLGYNLSEAQKSSTGFVFEPSIGLTYLNDFKKFKTFTDIVGNKKLAVYGTILLYKW